MKTLPLAVLALGALGLTASAALAASEAMTFKGHELASKATVSIETARATAMKARAGTITDQELETEKGGSGLRYSFDIKNGAKTYEVGVDARTGKVLENKTEGKNAD